MGYGEIGGGGSVHWKMKHGGAGGNGQGSPNGGNGRDPKPEPSEGGTFTILVNGVPFGPPVPIDFNNRRQIQVIWSPDRIEDLPRLQREADQAGGGGNPAPHASAPSDPNRA